MIFGRQWLILAVGGVLLIAVVVADLYSVRRDIEVREREQLQREVEIAYVTIADRIRATNDALTSVIDDLATLLSQQEDRGKPMPRLVSLQKSLIGVRSILVVDVTGKAVASNRKELIGLNFREQERYKTIRAGHEPEMLYISAPFLTPLGTYAVSAGKMIPDRRGNFNGYVLAVIDPGFFKLLLETLLKSPDMRASIIHADGKVVFQSPGGGHQAGIDLKNGPQTQVSDFLRQQPASGFVVGADPVTGMESMIALRTIHSPQVIIDKPLIISVSREIAAVYAGWRRDRNIRAGLLAAILSTAFIGLWVVQRNSIRATATVTKKEEARLLAEDRQRKSELETLKTHRLLTLAERSARAGSWSWNLETNLIEWSPEVYSLFGIDPDNVRPSFEAWLSVLHPDDAEEVKQQTMGAIKNRAPLANTYRIVRPDGQTRWIDNYGGVTNDDAGKAIIFSGIGIDVTERKSLEEALRAKNEEFEKLAEAMPQIVWVTRADGWNIYFNRQWTDYTGLTLEESYGHGWNRPFHPDDQMRAWNAWQNAVNNNAIYSLECRLRRKDGEYRWWLIRGVPVLDERGTISKWFGTCTDIEEIKQHESDLRIAAKAFESQQAIFITDSAQKIMKANKSFSNVTGYSEQEVIGLTPKLLHSGLQDRKFYEDLWSSLNRNHHWQGEIWNRRKNGEVYPELLTITAVTAGTGEVTNYVASFTDLTQNKTAEATIHNLSFYDKLTGLPNRSLMKDRLAHSLKRMSPTDALGAVLLIDIDDFKTFNDTRGHDVGDLLLIELARKFQILLRGEDTLSRVGSDEFMIILDNLSADSKKAADWVSGFAERLQHEFSQPLELGGKEYFYSACIGISLFGYKDDDVDRSLSRAEAALDGAKKLGRGKMQFFDQSMQAALEERVALEMLLRKAIPTELLLHYQPQVDGEGHIVGCEALVRWQLPTGELVPPSKFIPLAEESDLILKIGSWVLESACRQLKIWEANAGTRHLTIAVNVSAKEFFRADFVDSVLDALALTGANPRLLKLELTESTLIHNVGTVIDIMNMLKAKGLRFSLDDFGTGYSSLAYLQQLPIDQLKIDQSFMRAALTDASDSSIVRTIIALGHNLGLTVIAEGVETESQRNFLAVSGCRHYQGYLFGKPMPIWEFDALLAGRLLSIADEETRVVH